MNLIVNASEDNATATLYALVRGLKAKVTRATVREELAMHPDFPSLFSLSEVLTGWKIENMALRLNTIEQLRELPLPFVAHQKKEGGWYVLVADITGQRIRYIDSERGHITEPLADFEKAWTGVVLLAETNEHSGEPNYALNRPDEIRRNLRSPLLLTGSLLITFLIIISVAKNLTAPDWVFLLTKSAGLLFSSLLVAKQLGSKSALADRFCQLNTKTNCDSVLNSPGAKLWGWLSWADVGLLYFAGGLLTILLMGSQPNGGPSTVRPLLYGLALLALPYTIFSVYYQARIVRQWCTLCLMVQGVLLAESAVAIRQFTLLTDVWQPYATVLFAFLLPTLVWILIKPLLINVYRSQREHNELLSFKRNPNLFQTLLFQQTKMPSLSSDLHPIVIGDSKAEHTITMVTNPYCPPCAKMHRELEKLIERNTNIKVEIVFMACDGPSGKMTTVANHMLALSDKRQAMKDWYASGQRDYIKWSKHYPVANDSLHHTQNTQLHCNWCKLANIVATPTLFIDGYQKPDHYSLQQISQLISYLPIAKSIRAVIL
ncbi:vitamin K epoxide reductase family protein [Spirosoma soli]|uniref:Vitamin K epoxide reductase family protein n=1 Tax=Spirosoma soli TaxID=1770529 RepID=A0ABW5M7I1_9BACT